MQNTNLQNTNMQNTNMQSSSQTNGASFNNQQNQGNNNFGTSFPESNGMTLDDITNLTNQFQDQGLSAMLGAQQGPFQHQQTNFSTD